jgi:perosamine synthetase
MQVPQSKPNLGPLEAAAVAEVMASGVLGLGPRILAFEQHFRDLLSCPHALAVSSGTAGLHLAVRALGLGEGDEVITSPFSFVASSNCLEFERVVPRFVDIDPLTFNIDPARIEAAITPRTRAILPVHVFGQPADFDALESIARRHQLVIIEDACEALGATFKGRQAGTLGDIASFGFYPNKQVCTGEGGMVVTPHAHLSELIDSMRNQGRSNDGGWLRHERLGYNYRLDELSAAVGAAQMSRLPELLAARAAVAGRYHTLLADLQDQLTLPYVSPDVEMSWFVYVVRLAPHIHRDRAIHLLAERGVQCRPYFPPIHLQPYYQDRYGFKPGDFAVTEAVSASTLSLPFHGLLTEEEMAYVRHCLLEVLQEARA